MHPMLDYVNLISRRRIVVDLGACDIKVLLLERTTRGVRIVSTRLIDFADGGFMTQDESSVELQKLLEMMGEYPVILIIPEHLSLSRLTQFSIGPRRELSRESLRELSGWFHLGEDEEILWELRYIRKLPGYVNAGILTMARALDVDDQVQRLGIYETNLIRVTTPANALADAWSYLGPEKSSAILIEVGATTTAVVVIESGQSVYSTSFPIGGESLTEVIASYFDIPFDEAELRKREERFFVDEDQTPVPLKAAVESWLNELASVLEIQFGDPEYVMSELQRRPVMLSGGGSRIPGMLDYLRHVYGFRIESWEELMAEKELDDMDGIDRYLGALGAGWSPCQRQSLMPTHLRQTRFVQTIQFFANIVTATVIAGILIFLGVCSFREFQHFSDLNSELDAIERAFGRIKAIDSLMLERYHRFTDHLQLIEKYRKSLDWSRSINSLENARFESGLWMILLADKATYFDSSQAVATNLVDAVPSTATQQNGAPPQTSSPDSLTRLEQPGLVSQIVIDGPIEASLTRLSTMVERLKNQEPFAAVDRLPSDTQQDLVPEEFALTNQTFTLRLDWGGYDTFTFSPSWTNRFVIRLPQSSGSTNSTRSVPSTTIRKL